MKRTGLLLLALSAPASLAAQSSDGTAAAPPLQLLTLPDAIEIARGNSPSYLQSRNDAEVAAANVRSSFFRVLPVVGGNLSTSLNSQRTVLGTDDFDRPIQTSVYSQTSQSRYGLNVNLMIFDGGQRLRSYWNAKDEAETVDARVRDADLTLVMSVTTQYLNAARSERLLEVEDRNVQDAEARLRRAEQEYRLAVNSRADLLRAEQGVRTAQQSRLRAEAQVRKARIALWQTLGMEGEPAFRVNPELPEAIDPANLDVEALVARALAQSPSVLAAEASLRQSERQLKTSRWTQYLPTISANFGYNGGVSSRDDYSRFASVSDMSRGYSIGLSASLPLFETMYQKIQGSPTLTTQRIGVEDAEYQVRQQRLSLEADVRQRMIDLQTAYEALLAARDRATLAAQILQLTEEEYRLGTLPYISYESAINEEAAARRAVVDAEFDLFTQRSQLERLLGGPLVE